MKISYNTMNNLKNMNRGLLNSLSYNLNYPLQKPETVGFLMTYKCCLNCVMCDSRQRSLKSKKEELTLNEYLGLIDQLNKWNVKNILLSGGEPLTREKDCLEIIRYATSLKFNTTLVTNAFLADKKICKEFYKAGLTNFTTSLDGAAPSTHDSIRRTKGSFKKVVNALSCFNRLKLKDNNPHFSLNCTTVVMNSNFKELVSVYSLLRKVGVTNIMYQAVSGDYPELMIPENRLVELNRVIECLITIKNKHGHISNSETYFKLLPDYYKSKISKTPFTIGACLAAYNNLIITPSGGVDICGYGPYDVTTKDEGIKKLWYSKEFKQCRKRIKSCNRQCMYLCYKKGNIFTSIKDLIQK